MNRTVAAMLVLGIVAGRAVADETPASTGAITRSAEIKRALTRSFEVVPVYDEEKYTVPETSWHISLPTVLFEYNSDALQPTAREQLDEVAEALREMLAAAKRQDAGRTGNTPQPFRLIVDGHTCDIGPDGYNKELSARRAEAVGNYLKEQGLPKSMIHKVRGWGEERPAEPNVSETARTRNRRVDFVLLKHASQVTAGGRGVLRSRGAYMLDVQFEAIAHSEGGRRYRNNDINVLKSGDHLRCVFTANQSCHVCVVARSSQGEVCWLLPQEAQESGRQSVWCYYGEKHELPCKSKYYRLDEVTGEEVFLVAASPGPIPAAPVEAALKRHAGNLTPGALREAIGNPEAEMHLCVVDHR